jgi:hypothetical protein
VNGTPRLLGGRYQVRLPSYQLDRAVFDEEGGQWMFVQAADGVWTKKKVETGLLNFTAVAIRSGVREGDVVALQRPM